MLSCLVQYKRRFEHEMDEEINVKDFKKIYKILKLFMQGFNAHAAASIDAVSKINATCLSPNGSKDA